MSFGDTVASVRTIRKGTPYPYTLEYVFDDTWIMAADQQISCLMIRFTHGATTGYIWVDRHRHVDAHYLCRPARLRQRGSDFNQVGTQGIL
jgi:hypothetical protein